MKRTVDLIVGFTGKDTEDWNAVNYLEVQPVTKYDSFDKATSTEIGSAAAERFAGLMADKFQTHYIHIVRKNGEATVGIHVSTTRADEEIEKISYVCKQAAYVSVYQKGVCY